jgi:hypothetical protein
MSINNPNKIGFLEKNPKAQDNDFKAEEGQNLI